LPGEIDRVTALKIKVEDYNACDEFSADPHVACSLLKLWLREMAEPLFPIDLSAKVCYYESKFIELRNLTKSFKFSTFQKILVSKFHKISI
jgi:hypothetical protein